MAGKRVGHFKPLSLVVVLATVYGLLKHFFVHNEELAGKVIINGSTVSTATINTIIEWVNGHNAIMALLVIPLYALASFLAYREQGYNYAEHLVLNAYTSSLRLLVTLVTFPLTLLTQHKTGSDLVDKITTVLEVAVTLWCFIQFFNNLKWHQSLKKLAVMYLIFFGEMIVIGTIAVAIIITFIYPIKL
jgi:hypothetical protein